MIDKKSVKIMLKLSSVSLVKLTEQVLQPSGATNN